MKMILIIMGLLLASCTIPVTAQNYVETKTFVVTKSPTQHVGVFVSTTTGVGFTSPYTTNYGDINPPLPFNQWVEFDIPSSFPDDVNYIEMSGIFLVTNPTNKTACFYLKARSSGAGEVWDNWAAVAQVISPKQDGSRENLRITIPVGDRKYQLKWEICWPSHAQLSDGVSAGLNMSVNKYGIAVQ